jgi:hypothetical protein
LNLKNKKAIGYNINKTIKPIATKPTVNREISTLLNGNKPFVDSANESNEYSTESPKGSHNRTHKHKSRHKHISGRKVRE